MLNSDYKKLCSVTLPFKGRQIHMHSFDLATPAMPNGYEDYCDIVKLLCKNANANEGVAYLTIDEKIVNAGESQRRPKPHIDGMWIPATNSWDTPRWNGATNSSRMPLILASSIEGCRAWRGKFNAIPKSDGDLSHIEQDLGSGELLQPNMGYILSSDCVHESIALMRKTARSLLRITLPVSHKFAA